MNVRITSVRSPHLYGIDLLRLVAAGMVMLNHFALFGWREANGTAVGADAAFPQVAIFGGTGAIGVQIFFVISGFVIAMSASKSRPLGFVLNRIVRIVPTLWVCATIALVARAAYGESLLPLLASYARTLILFPMGPYIDGVAWTLVVEAVFYAVVFAAMLVGPALSLQRVAIWLGCVSGVFLVAFALSAAAANAGGTTVPYEVLGGYAFKVLLLRHGVFFAIGMLIFSATRDRTVEGSRKRDPDRNWNSAALAAFTGLALLEIAVSAGSLQASLVRSAIWIAGLAAILLSIRHARAFEVLLAGRTGVVRELGRLSYPLYLNHYALGMVLVPTLFALGLGSNVTLVVSLVAVTGSAWLIVRGPERAGQAILHRLFAPLTAVRPTRSVFKPIALALLAALAVGLAFVPSSSASPGTVPTELAYGDHPAQILDLYTPAGAGPFPFVVYVHGGGWWTGSKANVRPSDVEHFIDAGIAFAAIDYRSLTHGAEAEMNPPILAPLHDTRRAVQYLRYVADAHRLNAELTGIFGASSGGFNALWLGLFPDQSDAGAADPVERQSTLVTVIGAVDAQTSLDPQQMRSWVGDALRYGGHAFGLPENDFEAFLEARERILPLLANLSPAALARSTAPPVHLLYTRAKAPEDREHLDFVHSPGFGTGFMEIAQEKGMRATLSLTGRDGSSQRPAFLDRIVKALTP